MCTIFKFLPNIRLPIDGSGTSQHDGWETGTTSLLPRAGEQSQCDSNSASPSLIRNVIFITLA
jgi:hypothetical protein